MNEPICRCIWHVLSKYNVQILQRSIDSEIREQMNKFVKVSDYQKLNMWNYKS